MKRILLLCSVMFFAQCTSIRVFADHDSAIDFTQFKTFSFYQPGIDSLKISDLDKRRILGAVEDNMRAKGLSLSETPDLLVNVSVKAKNRVIVNQNFGWGFGGWGFGSWGPWMMGMPGNSISSQVEGELFIDILTAQNQKLIWQGKGLGGISEYGKKRDERIRLFVERILLQYPPVVEEK